MSAQDANLCDSEIRNLLRQRLIAENSRSADAVLVEELGLCRGQVRVDIAVVNGRIHGYEIKSDRDGLRRLPEQVRFYSDVLDRATLVVGSKHLERAIALLPNWWGVLRADQTGSPRLVTVRRGRGNPRRDTRALAELLWRADALDLLALHGAARGVRGKPRRLVWDRLCDRVPAAQIAAAVRSRLKATASQRSAPSLS